MLVRKNTTDSSLAWYTLIVDTRTTPSCVLSCEEGGEREDVGDNECGQASKLAAGEHGVLCGVSVYSASTKCVLSGRVQPHHTPRAVHVMCIQYRLNALHQLQHTLQTARH